MPGREQDRSLIGSPPSPHFPHPRTGSPFTGERLRLTKAPVPAKKGFPMLLTTSRLRKPAAARERTTVAKSPRTILQTIAVELGVVQLLLDAVHRRTAS